MEGITEDGAGKLAGPARRAVLFLRGRQHRRHVDVTESAADDVKKMGWRQRLGAVFAETVDINQVIAQSRIISSLFRTMAAQNTITT